MDVWREREKIRHIWEKGAVIDYVLRNEVKKQVGRMETISTRIIIR